MRLLTDASGFGLVYEAFEQDRPKILKLLKPIHNQYPKAIQLFEQEARVLGRLNHPGVPSIDSDGCFQLIPTPNAEPLHCIVMEKIDGPNLSEWMHQQGHHPISEHQALRWLQQLVEVLHLIHQQQYFHRDIKPENIMLRASGQLVLVDFGAVREISGTYLDQLESEAGITRISSVGYSAPEQERGKAVPQSDFYSLGWTFIYLLTGKKPLDPEIYDSMTNEFGWRSFAPHISSELADFIDQLTAARVIDRPTHTSAILAQIETLRTSLQNETQPSIHAPGLQDQTVPMSSPPDPVGDQKQSATQPPTAGFSRASASDVSSGNPAQAAAFTEANLGDGATLPPDSPLIGGIQTPSTPQNVSSDPSQPLGLGDFGRPDDTVMQAETTQMQSGLMHQELRRLKQWVIGLVVILGGLLAVWGGRSLYRFTLQSNRSPQSQDSDPMAAPTHTAPDDLQPEPAKGNALESADSDLFFTATSTLEGHTSAINALALSLDQRLLASASDDSTVRLWDLESGQAIQTLEHGALVQAVAMSPNAQLVVSGGADGLIKLWNSGTGKAIATLSGHGAPINDLTITIDGRLVSASADKTLKVWDMSTYKELATLKGHTSYINTLDISPDGTLLASGAADRTIKLWDLNTYQETTSLTGHDSFVNTLLFSLNGNALISGDADHQIKIWDYQTKVERHTLSQHKSFVNALAMTRDGQYLISTSADQTLKIWDLSRQTVLHSIHWPNTLINAVVIRFNGASWQILAAGEGGSHAIQMWTLDPSTLDE